MYAMTAVTAYSCYLFGTSQSSDQVLLPESSGSAMSTATVVGGCIAGGAAAGAMSSLIGNGFSKNKTDESASAPATSFFGSSARSTTKNPKKTVNEKNKRILYGGLI